MKKISLIITVVIGGIIFLGVGFFSGVTWVQKQIQKSNTESPFAVLLASKVINDLTTVASGEITAIGGRNLTLNKEENSLIISVRTDALIYRLSPSEETATEVPQPVKREEIQFGEIKIGDKVNISCQLKADGTLEGTAVTVLP